MLIMSNMGDQVWLMTSRHTDPDLSRIRPYSVGSGEAGLQLVDVGVEDAVREAYARRLVRVGVGEFDVDLPQTAFEWCCVCQ